MIQGVAPLSAGGATLRSGSRGVRSRDGAGGIPSGALINVKDKQSMTTRANVLM